MGGYYPSAALQFSQDNQQNQQQNNPIAEYGKALALKSLMGNQQLQQGQVQIQQQQLQDQKAMTSAMQQAYQQWDGKDYRTLYQQVPKLALANGASANAVQQVLAHAQQQ